MIFVTLFVINQLPNIMGTLACFYTARVQTWDVLLNTCNMYVLVHPKNRDPKATHMIAIRTEI